MKKKLWISILAAGVLVAVLVILFLPLPGSPAKDGGTREYRALTYKIVRWNRAYSGGTYRETQVYWGADAYKTLDALWAEISSEFPQTPVIPQVYTVRGVVVGNPSQGSFVLESVEGTEETSLFERITVVHSRGKDPEEGDYVTVSYAGDFPGDGAVLQARGYSEWLDFRPLNYSGQWLNRDSAELSTMPLFEDFEITRIYGDCFFAVPLRGEEKYPVKFNKTLDDNWCPSDFIFVTYKNIYTKNGRREADVISVAESNYDEPQTYGKPVIYLYPEEETEVSVKLHYNGQLTCVYPEYNGEWRVTAAPDGTLTDEKGQTYNYLYWEGVADTRWDLSKGFCVAGKDTAAFLEDALAKLGLTRREANEFIVYWLPIMQENPYNVISFQTRVYTDSAVLEIDPAPDTLIRVFMVFEGVDAPVEVPPQTLTASQRKGFTVVEWGASEIVKSEK